VMQRDPSSLPLLSRERGPLSCIPYGAKQIGFTTTDLNGGYGMHAVLF
jgi:hypothetical protein